MPTENVSAGTENHTRLIAAIALVAAVLFFAGQAADLLWLRLLAKPIPVLCMALWVALLPGRDGYQLAIVAGLLFSALGDVLLSLSESVFVFGLLAFLVAHVAYVVAFFSDSRRLAPWRAVIAYGYGAVAFGILATAGDLGAMVLPVALYVIVICSMLWRAAARLGAPGVRLRSGRIGLIGAVLFAISDSVLAFDLFVAPVPLAAVTIMVTYWLGQLGISLSAARRQL